jgi:hypothetical protein
MTARISSYRPGLVDLVAGQISREIFVNDEISSGGTGTRLLPRLAVRRARELIRGVLLICPVR